MKFTLTIEFGNDAMQTYGDLASALRSAATRIDRNTAVSEIPEQGDRGKIQDINGNTVGQWRIV